MATDDLDTLQPDTDLATGRSTIDRIRQRHARRVQHIDLAIPDWDGDVVVRFGRVPKKVLIAAGKRKGNVTRTNAQILANSCAEVFVRNEAGDLEPASNADEGAGPVRFDGRLAELFSLGADAVEPADIVVRMYGDDVAIGAHVKRVIDWQTGADLDELSPEEVEEETGGF